MMQMHKKYLEKSQPILADGDFMGVFLDSDQGVVTSLVREGLRREELVIVSPAVASYLSEEEKQQVVITTDIHLYAIIDLIKAGRTQARDHVSGRRFIVDTDTLFGAISHSDCKALVDTTLRLCMGGKESIACVYESSTSISFSKLCVHPRIYIQGQVKTNPYFILPKNIHSNQSDLAFILDEVAHRPRERMLEGETFPMGLNADEVSQMLESIVDSMGAGVVVGDLYGNMVLYNKAAQKMMGFPASPLPYAERIMRFGNYLPDKVTPYPYESLPLSKAVRGENFDNELLFVKNANKPQGTWLQITGRGVRDSKGELIGGVLVSRDVTEERMLLEENERLQKNLIQNQKLDSLEVLAGGIAHDFNNLLVGVLGNASIILQQTDRSNIHRTRIEQIEEAGLQLSDLTKQLLVYAGINPSKGYVAINLNELTNSMVGLVEAAVSKRMHVTYEPSEGTLPVEVDEVQVRQVLLNLSMNAADAYQGQGGDLSITTFARHFDVSEGHSVFYSAAEYSGMYAGFEVKDFAGGIDEKILGKIFDPFFSTKGMGRGLGLSAVLGIVKAHRGFLELETKRGEGTCFRVCFPMKKGELVLESEKRKKAYLGSCLSVLVIDDEVLVLEVASSILTHHGISVRTASSGREGLTQLKNFMADISLVILDMNMPDLHGEAVYRHIRTIHPTLPVIISSGFSKELCGLIENEEEHCFYLEKPYSATALLDLIGYIFSYES